LIGQTAVVLTPVSVDGGTVRLGGELWSARAEAGVELPIEVESRVRVLRIDGATAVVEPVIDHGDPPP
jgi:membrane protein implicated in regulation of membrane protease activity